MGTAASLRSTVADRRVVRGFALLVSVPLGLAVVEILLSNRLPEPAISALEPLYAVFVYLPVAVVGAFVLEPLGIPELVAGSPVTAEIVLLATLVCFYYLLAVATATLASVGRRLAAE
ncbi:hypothetical protein [Saliphagus sp. LR7]|uniref:hypothetical protein n=1 Tax=Saliphagus sp. LR7 TaxID=2282654 RepID=UPI000DF85D20|nr:hypothetical protein [Saliphagus sp. LR7]